MDVSPANDHGDVESDSNSTTAPNLQKLSLGGDNVAFSMDGKSLAAASNSGVVSIFDTRTLEKDQASSFTNSILRIPSSWS